MIKFHASSSSLLASLSQLILHKLLICFIFSFINVVFVRVKFARIFVKNFKKSVRHMQIKVESCCSLWFFYNRFLCWTKTYFQGEIDDDLRLVSLKNGRVSCWMIKTLLREKLKIWKWNPIIKSFHMKKYEVKKRRKQKKKKNH